MKMVASPPVLPFDPLTQLPNGSQFRDSLSGAMARASRNKQLVAVLFVGARPVRLTGSRT